MRPSFHQFYAFLLLGWVFMLHAQPVEYQLLSGFNDALFSYPGADQLVGTGDDVVSSQVTDILASDPNVFGSYSYLAFEVPGTAADPVIGGNNIAAFFLTGSLMVDEGNTAQPIVSGDISTTGYGQGVGILETSINSVQALNIIGSNISAVADLDVTVPTFGGITLNFPVLNLNGTGNAVFCNPASCNSGIAYLDNIIAPAALARGATRLAYLEIDGQVPAQSTLPVVATNGRAVLVGATGMPSNVDLTLGKSTSAILPVVPGQTFSYSLTLKNNGTAAAFGIQVNDPIPAEVQYLSNNCSAPGPVNGLFRWGIDTLAAGHSIACDITVRILTQTIFDHRNAAVAYSNQMDSDFKDNISAVTIATVSQANEGIIQLPSNVTAVPADAHCSACPLTTGGQVPPQTAAENFVVHDAFGLQEIVFNGFYSSGTPFIDDFTVEIYSNIQNSALPGINGVPGDLFTVINDPVIRQGPGPVFAYRISTDLTLPRGVYWLAVRNDSTPSDNDWAWISADADVQGRSYPGIAVNSLIPLNLRWNTTDNFRLSLQLTGLNLQEIFYVNGFE